MSNKYVVYTAIFDDYDVLLDPCNPSENVDYICFTDNKTKINSDIWKTINIDESIPPNMKNRKVKILPHKYFPKYNASVYVDGNIEIKGNIEKLIEKYLTDNKLAVLNHPQRNCIYDEAKVLAERNIGNPDKIKEQVKRYREVGFPENYGLSANRIIMRKHNDNEVIDLMKEWWSEMKKGVKRADEF